MDSGKLKEAIEKIKNESPQRKFKESVELTINLKEIDLSNPKNRINEEIVLPAGRGKEIKVGVIGGNELISKASKLADKVISAEELDKLAENKKEAKKLVNSIDYFIADTALMGRVGKILGPIMGPRGKVPRPIPASVDPAPIINNLRRTVRARSKEKPVIHVAIGTREMETDKLVQNAMEVVKRVTTKLEKGEDNIRTVFVKTTMGPSQKVEVK